MSLLLVGCVQKNAGVADNAGIDNQGQEGVGTGDQQAQEDKEDARTMQVKVYFARNNNVSDCSRVEEFTRTIPYTQGVGVAAINEMLKGPSTEEGEIATNAVPLGTKLLNLTIENGIARATFSKELQNYGGGSCSVFAIRAQIEKTLKQFSTVNSVEISVEGVPQEEVLQP